MAANEHRGETDIVLDGAPFVMRPTYEAIVAVETATGSTIGAMAMLAANLRLPLGWLAIVVTEFVRAWGKATGDATAANLSVVRVGGLLQEAGIAEASTNMARVLMAAATGGYTAAGNPKPTMEKTTTDPSIVG